MGGSLSYPEVGTQGKIMKLDLLIMFGLIFALIASLQQNLIFFAISSAFVISLIGIHFAIKRHV